jgi:hypothetical protein
MKHKRPVGISVLSLFVMVVLLLSQPAFTGGQWKASAEEKSGTEAVTINLIDEFPTLVLVGEGKFTLENGRILGDNRKIGDTGLIRTVKIEPGDHVLIEALAIIREGTAVGIVVVKNEYTDSFQPGGWFCVNADIDFRGSKFFGYGTMRSGNVAAIKKDRNLGVGKIVHLAMEILPDTTVRAFYNGDEYTDDTIVDGEYEGGYPGIMTYFGEVEFISATVTYFSK